MALFATLEFGDNEAGLYSNRYNVVECKCHFTRHYTLSHPDGDPVCDKVSIVVISPGKGDQELLEWYISDFRKSGRIVFDITDSIRSNNDETRTLSFEEARCCSISEEYDINTSRLRSFRIDFIPEALTIDSIKFEYNG